MGAERGHRRTRLSAMLLLLLLLLFLSAAALAAGAEERVPVWKVAVARRLAGPGSTPPSCRGRCGGCAPCRPVHVAIQLGRSFPLEYYPEAWRCKCGSSLFMP